VRGRSRELIVGDLCLLPAFGAPLNLSVQCRSLTYMSVRVEFRWSTELLARVDAVRGDVPRASWVRRAVEQALEGRPGAGLSAVSPGVQLPAPAPAEQPGNRIVSSYPDVDENAELPRPRAVMHRSPRVVARRDVKPFQRK
jgi:hypothetical protein